MKQRTNPTSASITSYICGYLKFLYFKFSPFWPKDFCMFLETHVSFQPCYVPFFHSWKAFCLVSAGKCSHTKSSWSVLCASNSTSYENLLEMTVLGLMARTGWIRDWGRGQASCFSKPSRWLCCLPGLENLGLTSLLAPTRDALHQPGFILMCKKELSKCRNNLFHIGWLKKTQNSVLETKYFNGSFLLLVFLAY